jgi:rubredoxin
VKKRFKFPSNKLDYVSGALGLGNKTPHDGMPLWVSCMADDPKAWKLMEKYNRQDVVLTEKLYDRLLPWIPYHPNMRLYDSNVNCPRCGSKVGLQRRGFAYTNVSKFQRWQCTACGGYFRSTSRIQGSTLTEAVL